jgi:bacterioferritin (cytochrome b1)
MLADAAVLNSLLELERMAVLAYSEAQPKLGGEARRIAQKFLAHERAHGAALEREIRRLGGHPILPRPARAYTSGFPPLRTSQDVLQFALDLENTQISAYGDSLGTVVTPGLRSVVASILATEAEHMSVILGQLHLPQAPDPTVTGNAPT